MPHSHPLPSYAEQRQLAAHPSPHQSSITDTALLSPTADLVRYPGILKGVIFENGIFKKMENLFHVKNQKSHNRGIGALVRATMEGL